MAEVVRVVAEEIRPRVMDGEALLICAYDSDDKFNANHLEGAISLSAFKGQLSSISKGKELVFYCG